MQKNSFPSWFKSRFHDCDNGSITAFLVLVLTLSLLLGIFIYKAPQDETDAPVSASSSPSEEDQLTTPITSCNKVNQQPLTSADFGRLFPGWVLLQQHALSYANGNYCIVVMGRYQDEYNNGLRISVCKKIRNQWNETWHIPKDMSTRPFDLYHPPDDWGPNITIVTNTNKALVVVNYYTGGAHRIDEVIAVVLDDRGKGVIYEENWAGAISLSLEEDKILVEGEGSYGIHIFSLDNDCFKLEKIPRSEMAPYNSVEARFTIDENNMVHPIESSEIMLKVGQTIAFIPNDDRAKERFDSGEISLYLDAWNGPPVTACHANEILTGNYYIFDKPGVYHFLLQGVSHSLNSEPTFTITVEPLSF